MPLLERHLSPLWGIWKIDETWEELLQQSERPDEYLIALEGFTSENRKTEWLAVRLLLKYLLHHEAIIAYHENGVPYLPDYPYHISISHTKGYAAVLLDKVNPAGIDIEYRSDRVLRIKSRFMNEAESGALGDLHIEQWLVCWSAKETVFKMMRQKAADLREDIHILSFLPNDVAADEGFLLLKEMMTPASAVYRVQYMITPDFVMTRGIGVV